MTVKPDHVLQQELDRLWGHIKYAQDTNVYDVQQVGNNPSCRQLADSCSWSITKTRGLLKVLAAEGSIVKRWTHQHQSYWSAHYIISQPVNPHSRECDESIPF